MQQLRRSEYLNFLISRIENDLGIYTNSPGIGDAVKVLGILRNADNILSAIYLISAVVKLKELGNYLLFVLKKIDEGKISFDNLTENVYEDREYIINEIVRCFSLEPPKNSFISEVQEGIIKTEGIRTKESGKELKIKETQFVVENIENELVTEEFNESDLLKEYDLSSGGKYLELVNEEHGMGGKTMQGIEINGEEKESVYTFPDEQQKLKKSIVTPETEEEKNIKENFTADENKKELIDNEVAKEISQESLFEEIKTAENNIIESSFTAETEQTAQGEVVSGTEIAVQSDNEISKNEEKNISSEETETSVVNSKYAEYERELFIINDKILSDIEDFYHLSDSGENERLLEKLSLKISENSALMERRSLEMSFELISLIYQSIKIVSLNIRKTAQLNIKQEVYTCLIESIGIIGSLIRGDEKPMPGKTLKTLEEIKNKLLSLSEKDGRKKSEKKEKSSEIFTKEEKDIESLPLNENLLYLKQNILDIENILKSLSDISGEFQAYEALRRLSSTFTKLKNIVRVSRETDMHKMAQLAESSYTFIKFLQNYRVNPFEEELKEVFKYLIYSFKLLFLDKPAKDLDLFISYLNEPVKIFINKNKTT